MKKYSINKNNTGQWKKDVQKSVIFYNSRVDLPAPLAPMMP